MDTISWLDEIEKLSNIETLLPKESMKYMKTCCLYLKDNCIMDITRGECIPIVEDSISSDKCLHYIHTKKHIDLKSSKNVDGILDSQRYKFDEMLLYHIDIEPESIQHFKPTTSLITIPYSHVVNMQPIQIPPSISCFHPVNVLIFVFHQVFTKPNTKTKKRVNFKLPLHLNKTKKAEC